MGELQQLRNATEQQLASLQRERDERAAAVAEEALKEHVIPAEEPFAALTHREHEHAENLRNLIARKQRASAILDRVSELEQQQKEQASEHKTLMRNLEPLFRPIGELSFKVYRENPLVDQEFAEIFAPLVEQLEQIKASEREVAELERDEEKKPFLERVVVRGRLALARNRLNARRAQMERLHGKAGRRIVQTDFIGSLGDPELDEVTTPYLERIETATRIEKDLEIIDNELNALSAEYAETCEGYRAKGCVQELEAQIDAEMKKRQTVLTELGNALVAGETPAFGGGVQEQIAALRTIDSQIQETSDLRDRVNAGIEVERLEEAVQNNKKNIERKQNQIAELTAAITELEREQAELKEKKAEQEQKRGDRSLLVLSESSPNQ